MPWLRLTDRLVALVQMEYLQIKGLEQLLQTVGKVRRRVNPSLLHAATFNCYEYSAAEELDYTDDALILRPDFHGLN